MPLLADVRLKLERAKIQIIRWRCGVSMKDRRTSEEWRNLVGVEHIKLSLEVVGCDGMDM